MSIYPQSMSPILHNLLNLSLHSAQVEFNYVHINRSQAFKTVFLGNSNVGKTCLAKLIVDRKIVELTTNTIGFDHHTKEMQLEEGIPVNVGLLWSEGERERESE